MPWKSISYIFFLFIWGILCSRPLWRQGAVASFSTCLQLKYGSLRAPAASWWEAQEDCSWLSGPLEDCHPPANPTVAHGKREPETGGWVAVRTAYHHRHYPSVGHMNVSYIRMLSFVLFIGLFPLQTMVIYHMTRGYSFNMGSLWGLLLGFK